jgi:hypothetical protein
MADAIRRRFHRTELWRLRTGRRVAELDTADFIERATKGRIPVQWWRQRVREAA